MAERLVILARIQSRDDQKHTIVLEDVGVLADKLPDPNGYMHIIIEKKEARF